MSCDRFPCCSLAFVCRQRNDATPQRRRARDTRRGLVSGRLTTRACGCSLSTSREFCAVCSSSSSLQLSLCPASWSSRAGRLSCLGPRFLRSFSASRREGTPDALEDRDVGRQDVEPSSTQCLSPLGKQETIWKRLPRTGEHQRRREGGAARTRKTAQIGERKSLAGSSFPPFS
ncbi:hypothetical protein TGMAS_414300 [Toxoplasma gondii MAS]|uniref:Uncharacterized protein n=1 Tax=Toxoplasma gondii MAS TaxID=943118 RepID=A0A086QPG4_TOXGO|nr:hypothetical protein TGMAS_414300 [Toxoplasma gondii MAS]